MTEEVLDSIVSVRCTRAFSDPCEDCRLIVKSVVDNIETAGYIIQPVEEKEMEMETEEEEIAEESPAIEGTQNLVVPCRAPAPLVVNGSPYVGCQLPENHDGQHEVKVTWTSR